MVRCDELKRGSGHLANQDLREQLVNGRGQGTFAEVQLPLERVTTLHGILLDLDPKLYRPGNPYFPPADDPRKFFENIAPVLDRHPLACSAQVRMTGTGLHALVLLEPPVELHSEAEQNKWASYVRVVQGTLPTDTNAPGITAVTRPVGSTNSKNGAVVEVLREGRPVTPEAVEEFVKRVCEVPFKEVAEVLCGGASVTPCPVCKANGSRLDALDQVGMCYGRCGKVSLEKVLDCVYAPQLPADDGGVKADDAGGPEAAVPAAPPRKTKAEVNDPKKAARPAGPRKTWAGPRARKKQADRRGV
jgi:hypothetical protein